MKRKLVIVLLLVLPLLCVSCGLVGFDGLKPGAPVPGSAILNAVNTAAPDGASPITVNLNLLANIVLAYVLGKVGYNKALAPIAANVIAWLKSIITHPNEK